MYIINTLEISKDQYDKSKIRFEYNDREYLNNLNMAKVTLEYDSLDEMMSDIRFMNKMLQPPIIKVREEVKWKTTNDIRVSENLNKASSTNVKISGEYLYKSHWKVLYQINEMIFYDMHSPPNDFEYDKYDYALIFKQLDDKEQEKWNRIADIINKKFNNE